MAKSLRTNVGPDWGESYLASSDPKYRLIWASSGPEKSGKNYFGLTGPGPVAIHCMDRLGLEGTVEKFPEKEIHVFKYAFDKNGDNKQENAQDVVADFLRDIEISKKLARTIQIDETEIWECFRYSCFGDKSDAPKNYDKLNADYREWIHAFDETDCNLQLIQKVKEKWETITVVDREGRKKEQPKPSGRMEPTGNKEVRYLVQANLRHSWSLEGGFQVEIVNCRQNMGIAGLSFPALTLPDLGVAMFDSSQESDWA